MLKRTAGGLASAMCRTALRRQRDTTRLPADLGATVVSVSTDTVALAAVVVTGATALVGTVGGWIVQARADGRRAARDRLAADLDELRALLDEGARAMARYELTTIIDDIQEHFDAENAAEQHTTRLLIRLGRDHPIVAAYNNALVAIRIVANEFTERQENPDLAPTDSLETMRAAISAYQDKATDLVGSPLRIIRSGRDRGWLLRLDEQAPSAGPRRIA